MNKNIATISVVVLLVVVVGGFMLFTQQPKEESMSQVSEEKQSLPLGEDLQPLTLSAEEQAALQAQGLQAPSSEDGKTQAMTEVRSSSELNAIESDLNETDFSGIDSETSQMDQDVSTQ